MQLQFRNFQNYLIMQLQVFFPELILHKYSVGGYWKTDVPQWSSSMVSYLGIWTLYLRARECATLRGAAETEAVWRRGGGDAAMTRGTADGILSLLRHCHLEGFLDKKNSLWVLRVCMEVPFGAHSRQQEGASERCIPIQVDGVGTIYNENQSGCPMSFQHMRISKVSARIRVRLSDLGSSSSWSRLVGSARSCWHKRS